MMTRLSLPRGLFVFLTSALLGFVQPVLASSSRTLECDSALQDIKSDTLAALRSRNTEHLAAVIAKHPLPGFAKIEDEVRKEQVGELAPRALQQMVGPEFKMVETPAPTAGMDTAVNLHEEGKSIAFHVDQEWAGHRTSTTVYASLPKTIKPHNSPYLVNKDDYPVVLVHLHGGGTPTATGKNAMSIAQALAGDNIPVLAMDLPGHGRATRQLKGLMTFQEQIDWVLAIVKKMVAPNVKIVLSGHSWGGEFAEFMYRHSHEARYAQIEKFFAISPPVDVSLGGDPHKKIEWEENYKLNLDSYKARTAPADFEFLKNSLYYGKDALVPRIFTAATDMDYQTPPLTAEQQQLLKPRILIVGENDGLVRVGVEKEFDVAFSNPVWPSRVIVIGKRKNWKSEKEGGAWYDSGHNVWDGFRLALSEHDVNTEHEVYGLLREEILQLAGPGGMGADQADPAEKMLNDVLHGQYDFFLLRQLMAHRDEYVLSPTAEREVVGRRKVELKNYIGQLQGAEAQFKKETEAKVKASLDPLRQELGLRNGITVEKAAQEISMPVLTDARRAELEAYVKAASDLESQLRTDTAPDPKAESELRGLAGQFKKQLERMGISDIKDYKIKFDEITAKKSSGKLSPEERDNLSALSRIHQVVTDSARRRQESYNKERARLVATLKAPEGVTDLASAKAELAPRNPVDKLKEFIERAAHSEKAVRDQAAAEWATKESAVAKPSDIHSLEEAKATLAELAKLDDFTFSPPSREDLAEAAADVKAKFAARAELNKGDNGLEKLEAEAKKLFGQRAKLVKIWEGAWGPKTELTSPRLREAKAAIDSTLKEYETANNEYFHNHSEWMFNLKMAGQFNEENLLNPPALLVEQRATVLERKAIFEKNRDSIDRVRAEEALVGALEGPQGAVKAATDAARELWGNNFDKPAAESVVARARDLDAKLEEARSRDSIARQELERAQWYYSQEMMAAGQKLPQTVTRVPVGDLLDLDYQELLTRLRNDPVTMQAFRNTMDTWTKYLALLRVEASTKDAGNY